MGATYKTERLSADCVDTAYALINLVAPTLDLETWRAICRNLQRREPDRSKIGDIITAINPLGYVQGLCVASLRDHDIHGRLLDVPLIVIASAADEGGVAIDVIDHLESLAEKEKCSSVRIWTSETDSWKRYLCDREVQVWEHGILLRVPRQFRFKASL